MTSSRPYLVRALYEWVADNGFTPYVIIDATAGAVVPQEHVQDGRIVLNISMSAVHELDINNDALQFKARFGGIVKHIYAPTASIVAIYAKENGRGMVFSDEDLGDDSGTVTGTVTTGDGAPPPKDEPPTPPKRSKPNLKIVK